VWSWNGGIVVGRVKSVDFYRVVFEVLLRLRAAFWISPGLTRGFFVVVLLCEG
jgi:hypothetical protein